MYGPHIYFVELNGQNHYVGFGFVDLSYAGKSTRNKSPKRFIRRIIQMCGFEDKGDYLASLPGHDKGEKASVSIPVTSNEDGTFVYVTYSSSLRQNHKLEFKFKNAESCDNKMKRGSLKFLKWFINITLFANEDMIPMLLVTPTIEQIKQYYCNTTEPDSSDVELWFCSDWKDSDDSIDEETLTEINHSIVNLKEGVVSPEIDLSDFTVQFQNDKQ